MTINENITEEKINSIYDQIKEQAINSKSLIKYFLPKNYGFILPGDSYKDRIIYNIRKHHIPYILFYMLCFLILSIRYLSLLPVVIGVVAYCIFKENIDSHITIGTLAINSFHILISVILFNLIYIFVFSSVFFTILIYSMIFCGLSLVDFTFFRELNEELNEI